MSPNASPEGRFVKGKPMPAGETWKLMEVLSILTILLKADKVLDEQVFSMFRRTGPILILENGQNCFVWSQLQL